MTLWKIRNRILHRAIQLPIFECMEYVSLTVIISLEDCGSSWSSSFLGNNGSSRTRTTTRRKAQSRPTYNHAPFFSDAALSVALSLDVGLTECIVQLREATLHRLTNGQRQP